MIEQDSIGTIEIPDNVYYGAYAKRSAQMVASPYKLIDVMPDYVKCVFLIKQCAAKANMEIGILDKKIGDALVLAAEEAMTGKFNNDYIVDLYQGNGDVGTVMNANEILAKRANEILTGKIGNDVVRPNEHASLSMATTDTLMCAAHVCIYNHITELQKVLQATADAFTKKIEEYGHVLRCARTGLRDSMPLTFAQTFSAYCDFCQRMAEEGNHVKHELLRIPLGGASIGNGIGSHPDFGPAALPHVQKITGDAYELPVNYFDTTQNVDGMLGVAQWQERIASVYEKIMKDLILLGSGPHAGLNEVTYPPNIPGSVTLPGKTNSTVEELGVRVCFKVISNAQMAVRCLENSSIDYNYLETLMNLGVMESFILMRNTFNIVLDVVINNLIVNSDVTIQYAHATVSRCIMLTPIFGYKKATHVGRRCYLENKSVRDIVVDEGMMTPEDADYFLNPINYTDGKLYQKAVKEAKEKYSN